ncbi:hypothetical protein OPIT5_24150 [Opitutaceae bacterium TAV5]|nr:hypothetical protein OPIT5_24150 [Opitutaceae bacterium TAV5]
MPSEPKQDETSPVESPLDRVAAAVARGFARSPQFWTAVLVTLVTFGFAWFCQQIQGPPLPSIQDEFSYLIAGETYAEGKLAMPRHPVWEYFESYHILQTPAYASKYPPAQGLFLALGIRLGNPIYGVWLSVALLAAAIAWMLFPLKQHGLAGLFGLWAGAWFGGASYWAQSFWGGAVAALGTVLVWGGLIRFWKLPSIRSASWMSAGAGILFLSRPFEGFLACSVPLGLIVWRLIRTPPEVTRLRMLACLGAGALPLASAFVFQGAVNHAVTGSAWRLPYVEYNAQYDANPYFLFQKTGLFPEFRHPRMEKFDVFYRGEERLNNPVYRDVQKRLTRIGSFYPGTLGIVIIATGVFLTRSFWLKWAIISGGVSLLGVILIFPFTLHYYAPLVAPLLIGLFTGATAIMATPLYQRRQRLCLGVLSVVLLFDIGTRADSFVPNEEIKSFRANKTMLEERLAQEPGKHLVVVRYTDEAPVRHTEYVYNSANIDAQRVIWARWMENGSNVPLFRYYKDRTFWLLTVGSGKPALRKFAWMEADTAPSGTSPLPDESKTPSANRSPGPQNPEG